MAPHQPIFAVHRIMCVGAVAAWAVFVAGRQSPPASQPAATTAKVVEFAPGVHIDWPGRQVELAARVVLRRGPLELLACSPRTREHESILVVQARPLHIFQAMGLIGLSPGRPFTYDRENDRWLVPEGDKLIIEARYEAAGRARTEDLWTWIIDTRTGDAAKPRDWLFCGSRSFDDGTFGADPDGTVICLVNFDTSLIGLGESHSADNEFLWAAANPETVPPEGTPCTLLIRAVKSFDLVVEMLGKDRFRIDGHEATATKLTASLRQRVRGDPDLAVNLRLGPGLSASSDDAKDTIRAIRQAGIRTVRIGSEIDRKKAAEPPG